MSPKELTAFRLELDVLEGLRAVKERDGVPYSVQVDRALRAWLVDKGVMKAANAAHRRRTRKSD